MSKIWTIPYGGNPNRSSYLPRERLGGSDKIELLTLEQFKKIPAGQSVYDLYGYEVIIGLDETFDDVTDGYVSYGLIAGFVEHAPEESVGLGSGDGVVPVSTSGSQTGGSGADPVVVPTAAPVQSKQKRNNKS